MIIPIWTKGKMGIVTGVVAAILGIAVIVMGFSTGSKESVNQNDFQYDAMTAGEIYDLGDTFILDIYASESPKNSAAEHYYVAGNLDSDDNLYIFSLKVTEDDAIYSDIQAYIDDDEQGIGNLKLPIVARASKLPDKGEDLRTFYDETVADLNELYYITPVENVQFTYLFDTADGIDDYNDSQRGSGILVVVVGLLALAFGVFLIVRNVKGVKPSNPNGGNAQPYYPQTPYQQPPQQPYQQAPQQPPYQQMPQQQPPQQPQTPYQPIPQQEPYTPQQFPYEDGGNNGF